MPTVGPQLPPHLLEKRKREDDEDREEDTTSSRSSSPDSTSKRQRTVGPTLPPAPLDERPPSSPSDSSKPHRQAPYQADDSSSSEDDFGPSLPTSNSLNKPTSNPSLPPSPNQPQSSQRDAWMLVPPTSGDWTSRIDPTKLKARAFKSSKSTTSKPTSNETWNETPEQKQARLQREMMGVKEPKNTAAKSASMSTSTSKEPKASAEDKETMQRMKEYKAARGPSLYDAHQRSQTVEKDDDPSARAFDREKDVGGGLQMNSTQRRDLMKKAGDFGSRFSSAKYL